MSHFSRSLLQWYHTHRREMPWRDEKDPYKIWVSEIMLQQTRVDQVMPYFQRFIARFPDVNSLAEAPQQDVLKVWEGLGYYSRARNLHAAAKEVVEKYNERLPQQYDEIIKLKGIGPYTAAAITSIAFNKPHAVVDGNVIRVLSRYFGIEDDVRSQRVVAQIQQYADELLDRTAPGDFNQALMELGAQVCTPRNPLCGTCPVQSTCVAAKILKTDVIPYKSRMQKKPHHHIGVGIIEDDNGKVLIALRPNHVMLGGLWEFPGGKQQKGEHIEQTVVRELAEELGVTVVCGKAFEPFKHVYSHFSITLHAFMCSIVSGNPAPVQSAEIRWVSIQELEDYPFPKANKILIEQLLNS